MGKGVAVDVIRMADQDVALGKSRVKVIKRLRQDRSIRASIDLI